jgi:hypothetical protein
VVNSPVFMLYSLDFLKIVNSPESTLCVDADTDPTIVGGYRQRLAYVLRQEWMGYPNMYIIK